MAYTSHHYRLSVVFQDVLLKHHRDPLLIFSILLDLLFFNILSCKLLYLGVEEYWLFIGREEVLIDDVVESLGEMHRFFALYYSPILNLDVYQVERKVTGIDVVVQIESSPLNTACHSDQMLLQLISSEHTIVSKILLLHIAQFLINLLQIDPHLSLRNVLVINILDSRSWPFFLFHFNFLVKPYYTSCSQARYRFLLHLGYLYALWVLSETCRHPNV